MAALSKDKQPFVFKEIIYLIKQFALLFVKNSEIYFGIFFKLYLNLIALRGVTLTAIKAGINVAVIAKRMDIPATK